KEALQDHASGIRENAAIIAEKYPECLPQLEKLVNDTSARVAFQATLSLGEFSGRNIVNDMVKVLQKYGSNSWFRTGVLSSKAGSSIDLLKKLIDQDTFFQNKTSWKKKFIGNYSYIIGVRNNKAQITSFLNIMGKESISNDKEWKCVFLKGLIKGTAKANPALREKLKNIDTDSSDNTEKNIQQLKQLLK